MALNEQRRQQLDGIVRQMVANNESEGNIQFVVNDFVNKYTEKQQPAIKQSALKQDLSKRLSSVKQTLSDTAKGKINPAETGLQTVGAVAGGVGDVAFRAISAITPEFVKTGLKKVGKEILQTELGKEGLQAASKGVELYNQWKERNPRTAKDLESAIDIASLLPIGKGSQVAGKVVSKVGQVAGKGVAKTAKTGAEVAKTSVGAVTGLSKNTIDTLISKPNLVTKAEKAGLDNITLGDKVKNAITKRIDELSSVGKGYEKIRTINDKVKVTPNIIRDTLSKYGIALEKGKLKVTTESVPLKEGDVKALQRFIDTFGGKTELTPNAFMNARTALTHLAEYDATKSDISNIIARELRQQYDNVGKLQINGLAELDKLYGPEKRFLDKFKKEYLIKDDKGQWALKDTALSKISNATNTGREKILERLEQLIPGIGEEINIYRALKDIEAVKSQKVGAYASNAFKGGFGGYAVSGGNPIGAIAGAILSSPEMAVPIIKAYGKIKNISSQAIDNLINKMKSGKKLLDNEKQLLNNALINGADKVNKTTAKVGNKLRPGLSLKNVAIKDLNDIERDSIAKNLGNYIDNSTDNYIKNIAKRIETGKDTKAELKDALNYMMSKGYKPEKIDLSTPLKPKSSGIIKDMEQEARKYKSVEEFINSKIDKSFKYQPFEENKKYFLDKIKELQSIDKKFATADDSIFAIRGDFATYKTQNVLRDIGEVLDDSPDLIKLLPESEFPLIREFVLQNRMDIFDDIIKKYKDKSQLIDIWNKAHNK